MVIERKLLVPLLPEYVISRPRLRRLLAELIESRRVLVLSATAGAGKTTAVVDALRALGWPIAWLTLDRTDALPGRLVTYIEAALSRHVSDLQGAATQMLTAGIPHPEVVGLLVEAVGEAPLVFVLDELERLEETDSAWAVIESLLRYAPPSMRIILLSRRDIPTDLCEFPQTSEVARIREADLSFTVDEAAEALAANGAAAIDATVAVNVTGGWVTGVLFEAWRSAEHVYGMGGEMDPLHGYLAVHVLRQLAPAEREFLVSTSLLDEVTAGRATALGQAKAGERLMRLRSAHLPVTWHPDQLAMTCHSRFREYLLACLERRGEQETRRLRLAYGRLLADEGYHEEATEELLAAGALEEAVGNAERVIADVVERLDLEVAERWLEALREFAPTGASPFTTTELMIAVVRDDFRRGVRVADQLKALGEREHLACSSELAAALMAWCYAAHGRLEDHRQVLEHAPDGSVVGAARYIVNALERSGGADRPELTGGVMDPLVLVCDFNLGRFSSLTELSGSRWAQAVARRWRISALRASGQTLRALDMYEKALEADEATPGLRAMVGPEILIDAGRYDDARRELARSREHGRELSPWIWLASWFAELRLVLRHDRDLVAARRILELIEPDTQRTAWHREGYETWHGLALLLEGNNAAALTCLRQAVDGMVAGCRFYYLPTAGVYLAEAEWRAGNETASDRAADCALDAARQQGSNHLLLQALADFPAVVSRRIDAEPAPGSVWHDLGRALLIQQVSVDLTVGLSVELYEFGTKRIVVNGEEVRPGISKSYELLSYLAGCRSQQAERDELLDALFDARIDGSARAYLRQAVRRLRQVLPDQEILIVEDGRVRIRDDVAVASQSERYRMQLAEAARLQGEARVSATLAALSVFDQGEYLPNVRSNWAEERRRQLTELAQDARCEAAELAFAAGRYADANHLLEEVLNTDPYRESVWRLSMRIANALGDDDGVMREYRACERALAELGAAPAPATRALLERMRR